MQIRRELGQGEPGYRIFLEQEGQGGTPQVIGIPSTYPEYFQGKGWTYKQVVNAIDKALAGKRLTPKQWGILEDLVAAKRAELAREAWKFREEQTAPKPVPAGNLKVEEGEQAGLFADAGGIGKAISDGWLSLPLGAPSWRARASRRQWPRKPCRKASSTT